MNWKFSRWTLTAVWSLWLWAAVAGGRGAEPLVTFRTDTAEFALDWSGSLCAIVGTNGVAYLAPGQPSPLLSLGTQGALRAPTTARWDAGNRVLTLTYPAAVAEILTENKRSHVAFTLRNLQVKETVDLAVWGPYPTVIGQIVGETVGVVRDGRYAVGIQALNRKTLGGYPTHENDIEADYSQDDRGQYPNLPAELLKGQGFRGDTARPTAFGSVLQAYCRDRSRARVISNWGHEKYFVPPFAEDGGLVGSSIALFACPEAEALATIGRIELAHALPHPLLDGDWAKTSPGATASYLIVDFSEENFDRALEMTRRAGLRYLYHSSPFETWGHFKLKPDLFPHGWDGLRACVDKARPLGVRLGFHTLSNFITPNDAYVSPKPDKRLAEIGASELTADLDASSKEIALAEPDYFRKKTALNTVRIGDELIRYATVSSNAPWRLLDCQRGAWGTVRMAHARGDTVGKLMDHDYQVFLTDASLAQEVARNIAALCNRTGVRQLSFDGLEGNWSTGYGQYGRTLFTTAWYDALELGLRGAIINDASNPGHFNWHIYTRMNWGEPWYAGFRESQTLYRFKNQVYFERNLMPHMLGWFALHADTSVEDAEWLLARAAGFDAGFTLAASLASTAQLSADPAAADTARAYGATPAILEAIKQWETARMSGAFPAAVKARLCDNTREFHLTPAGENRWQLFEAHLARVACDTNGTGARELSFEHPGPKQPLQAIIRSTGKAPLTEFSLEIDGRKLFTLQGQSVPAAGSLRYAGGATVSITDAHLKEVAQVPADAAAAVLTPGKHTVRVTGAATAGFPWKLELRTYGEPTPIEAGKGLAGPSARR